MAVLISDNRNPAYTGQLSATNAWWRVEAHNLAGFNNTSLSLGTTRTINLTFANAGNLRGIAVALTPTEAPLPKNIKNVVVMTLKNAGSTIATASAFRSNILGFSDGDTSNQSFFTPRFEFNTPVLTTPGIYTVEITNSGPESASWQIATSNGTAPFYLAWCDNQVTPVSGADCLCVQDPVNMNTSFATKCNGLATGDTTNGVSMVLLTNTATSGVPLSVANLTWLNPAAPYTLTVDGILAFSVHSGIRMGTETSVIPTSAQATILFPTTPSFGTARGTFGLRRSNTSCGGGSLFMYGEVPSQRILRLASTASTGQPNITLTTAPTSWLSGDRVYLFKTNQQALNFTTYTILSTSGTTVTFNSNITTTTFISGGPVINYERYGCRIIGANPLSNATFSYQVPYNLVMNGVYMEYINLGWRNQQQQNPVANAPNASQYLIQDVALRRDGSGETVGAIDVPATGLVINRFYTPGQLLPSALSFTPTDNHLGGYRRSGSVTITNCIFQGSQSGGTSVASLAGTGTIFSGNEVYSTGGNATGGQHTIILASFVGGVFKNNIFWRNNGAVNLAGVFIPTDWSGNTFDGQAFSCYTLGGNNVGVVTKNDIFGQQVANTNEVALQANVYQDVQVENALGTVKVDTTLQQLLVDNATTGSFRVVNDNQVANVDRIWNKNGFIVRTGTGLADTTKRNGEYALRFESNNNTSSLSWVKNQPIGNIQGKTMTVGIWMRINSANYWAAGHTMPRISVIYDNGISSTIHGQATQTAGSWQWVQATFTPTTTYGQITVILSTQTAATGSNAYVYFADFSGPLPQGSQLNLGEFNLWADAFPVTPLSFTSLINSSDVWSANLNNFGSNTAGNKLQNSSTVNQVGQLLADALNS